MTPQELQKHINQIENFLQEQDRVKEQYNLKGQQTYMQSLTFFGDDIIVPLKICDATILFLIFALAEQHFAKDKKQIQRMQLVTAYLQGIDISTNLTLEGNYIKASATLKQDYETIVRLSEINSSKAKDGKTPNPQNGPITYKEMYGYLNNIAHISKDNILLSVLKYESKSLKGVSPVKQFNKLVAHRLMTYNVAIKVEMFRQCLNLYFEVAGEDKVHEQGLAYYNFVLESCSKIGMLGNDSEQNGG